MTGKMSANASGSENDCLSVNQLSVVEFIQILGVLLIIVIAQMAIAYK